MSSARGCALADRKTLFERFGPWVPRDGARERDPKLPWWSRRGPLYASRGLSETVRRRDGAEISYGYGSIDYQFMAHGLPNDADALRIQGPDAVADTDVWHLALDEVMAKIDRDFPLPIPEPLLGQSWAFPADVLNGQHLSIVAMTASGQPVTPDPRGWVIREGGGGLGRIVEDHLVRNTIWRPEEWHEVVIRACLVHGPCAPWAPADYDPELFLGPEL